jgi:catechol-2,3-dioxygenase
MAFINNPQLEEANPNGSGIDHFAFTYANLSDLLATYERLKTLGIEPYWCINHGPTLSMYYRDPDANQIELQIDIFETPLQVNEWLAQSDFETNPIGVKFSPEDLIQRIHNGEDQTELLKRRQIDVTELADQFPTQ